MASGPLILASASPRRHDLLTALGVSFEVRPAAIDETSPEQEPSRFAEGLALRKARAVAANGRAVLGADTIVVSYGPYGSDESDESDGSDGSDGSVGRVLGKPADAAEARVMLASLRSRTHEVITAVAVVAGNRVAADCVRTQVRMRAYSDAEIESYVASGSPLDKAGAYAIQDEQFHPVETADGCICSVIGLPLWTTRRLLRAAAGIETAEPGYERCAACPLRKP